MLLAVDKPSGISSYDVIRKLKRVFPKQKIGHSWTLDPLATGLLLIGIDRSGTKLLHTLQGLEKRYDATIDLSRTSDTRDSEYREIISDVTINSSQIPSRETLEKSFQSLIPEAELPLPPFSAKKIQGKKSYDLARDGQIVTRNWVMNLYDFQVLDYTFPFLNIRFHVGSGTYIRSLAYRIWQQVGTGGIITKLRRTRIGDVDLEKLTLSSLGESGLQGVEIF